MGSPVSPIVANLHMEEVQTNPFPPLLTGIVLICGCLHRPHQSVAFKFTWKEVKENVQAFVDCGHTLKVIEA